MACNSILEGGRSFIKRPFGADRKEEDRPRKKKRPELNENTAVLKQHLISESNLDEYWISIGSFCANNI